MNVDLRVFWNTTDKWCGRTIGTLSKTHHSREMDWSVWYCPVSGLGKIQLTVACLSCSLHGPPVVHHYTSTILTGRLTGDWLSSFYFVKGSGSFMFLPKYNLSSLQVWNCWCRWYFIYESAQDSECLGLTTGLWGDYLMNLCFTAAVSEMSSRV